MEEFAKKNPALDDGFHPALLERAGELETYPLAQEEVDTSGFWWVGGVASEDLGNAKEAGTFFNAQRADPHLNGLLDGQTYGAIFSLSELAHGIQNALLLKPVRQGVNQDARAHSARTSTRQARSS